jgi:hypothetical protein
MAYLFSYKFGFVGRAFIGTIVQFLFVDNNGFLSKFHLWLFILCILILMCLIIAFYIAKVIKSSQQNTRFFAIWISILYLTSPISVSYLFNNLFGWLDLWLLFFTLLIVFLFNSKFKWFIPILCFCLIATHKIAVFFYIPTILIILIYNAYIDEKSKIKSIVLFIMSFIVCLISTIYF